MNNKNKLIITSIIAIAGLILSFWSLYVMRHYPGYLEIMREAKRASYPQLIPGLGLITIAYILFYKWK